MLNVSRIWSCCCWALNKISYFNQNLKVFSLKSCENDYNQDLKQKFRSFNTHEIMHKPKFKSQKGPFFRKNISRLIVPTFFSHGKGGKCYKLMLLSLGGSLKMAVLECSLCLTCFNAYRSYLNVHTFCSNFFDFLF